MSIPSNSHDGPVGGLFGGQVEQRMAHRDLEDHQLDQVRRSSRDSTRSSFETRLLGHSPQRSSTPSSRLNKGWLSLPWIPWRPRSAGGSHPYRPQHNTSNWWNPRRYSRFLPGSTAVASDSSVRGIVRYLQVHISAMVTAIIRGKRRKSWFLSVIIVSLFLTVLSGGYLLSQLQPQKDAGPSTTPLTGGENTNNDTLLDPGSGPRRDRNRGKKYRPSNKETGKGKIPPPSERLKVSPGRNKRMFSGIDNKTTDNNDQPSPDNHSPQGLRMCNLQDLIHGRWVSSDKQGKAPQWTLDQDLRWTGYGPKGCRSSIWNERYLLTPSITSKTTTRANALFQMDQEHAWQLKGYHWQVDYAQDRQHQGYGQGTQNPQDCWQPVMDLGDLVEVLKRAPLVMIGDKFLEQEYLTMECMIMGMQDELVFNYKVENNGAVTEEEALESLEYRIESEMPPIVELKVAPGSGNSAFSSTGARTGAPSRSLPNVYRKAKPGEMRLVDRASNLTLMTFIRSDALWDSGMSASLVAKHGLKSVAELSTMDVGGLHPDCKLVGIVLLCEPARIDTHGGGARGIEKTRSRWWHWLLGETPSTDNGNDDEDIQDDEEMSFGSDLDHDMINLEWIQSLEAIVQNSAVRRENAFQREDNVERKPVVMISNGHFWEFDPQDSIGLLQRDSDRKLSKTEEETMKRNQDKRRKLLRHRYTMMLTNTLDYIKRSYPDLRVVVQTSVRRSACGASPIDVATSALKDMKDQEAALLNALTKVRTIGSWH